MIRALYAWHIFFEIFLIMLINADCIHTSPGRKLQSMEESIGFYLFVNHLLPIELLHRMDAKNQSTQ